MDWLLERAGRCVCGRWLRSGARARAMPMTTYAVGELSALNGVMGAKAERSCVFHLVGMQTMRHQRIHRITHHTLGDGVFQNFANISAQAACVSAVITPDNCIPEMERLIATAKAESQPAYILVASDYAVTPVNPCDTKAYPKPASGPDLEGAIAAINQRIEKASSVAVLPAYTISRFKLESQLRARSRNLAVRLPQWPWTRGYCPSHTAICGNVFRGYVISRGAPGGGKGRSGN